MNEAAVSILPPAIPEKAPNQLWQWLQFGIGILGILIACAALATKLITKDMLPGCDSKEVRSTFSEIFEAGKVDVTAYNEIKTISSSKTEATCSASVSVRDGHSLEIDYRLFVEDGDKKFQVRAARDK